MAGNVGAKQSFVASPGYDGGEARSRHSPPLVGESWRGGYRELRVLRLTPPPYPSPARGEGTE